MQSQSKPVFKLAGLAILIAIGSGSAFAEQKVSGSAVTQDSVTTVDTLVKLDNAAALEKAKADAIKNGLLKPEMKGKSGALAKPVEPPPIVHVASISGVREELMTSLTVNGQNFPNLKAGASVRGCIVAEIKDRCVVLKPAPAETIIASSSGEPAPAVTGKSHGKRRTAVAKPASVPASRPEMCPTSCWTGASVMPTTYGSAAGMSPLPAGMPNTLNQVAPPLPRAPVTPPPTSTLPPSTTPTGTVAAGSFN